ncbi:hypothetical protein T484DRAFT_1778590 [Baffinella frigidus]|nr:hypothetical protein T484DRAFT_1778590 [Cryptophyta sp. CCMP2293]
MAPRAHEARNLEDSTAARPSGTTVASRASPGVSAIRTITPSITSPRPASVIASTANPAISSVTSAATPGASAATAPRTEGAFLSPTLLRRAEEAALSPNLPRVLSQKRVLTPRGGGAPEAAHTRCGVEAARTGAALSPDGSIVLRSPVDRDRTALSPDARLGSNPRQSAQAHNLEPHNLNIDAHNLAAPRPSLRRYLETEPRNPMGPPPDGSGPPRAGNSAVASEFPAASSNGSKGTASSIVLRSPRLEVEPRREGWPLSPSGGGGRSQEWSQAGGGGGGVLSPSMPKVPNL